MRPRGRDIAGVCAVAVLLTGLAFSFHHLRTAPAPLPAPTLKVAPAVLSVPVPEPLKVFKGTIGRRSTLASSLQELVPPGTVHALVQAARPVHDLARVSVGRPFGLTLEANGVLKAFEYGIDELRTLRVVREGESFKADLVTRDYETTVRTYGGAIESSLFNAIETAGAEDQLALDMADVFSWDVDFNTEVQRGDSFRVAVETMSLDGRFVRYGKILAAEFVRGERRLQAVRFQGEYGAGYYRPDGTPLRKAFLRSPLKFSRISSKFSRRRFHPVLGVYRPHLGVDYAAPTGTPVHAAGDGVVTVAGWLGGYGQTVKIRHPNGYETLYGHLSRILVRRGQRVAQGSPVGRVGATGLASGPHLDYRMQRNGAFVDPLKIVSPAAEPVRVQERAAFERVAGSALALLDGVTAGDAPVRTAQAFR